MNRTAFKIAASTTIVAMTMVGCSSQSEAMRRMDGASRTGTPDQQAARLHEQAARALREGQLPQVVELMEQAVALSPRDVGYRLLLADAYMRSGRLDSARSTYADVIELDPSNVRANLSTALLQIARGRPAAAIARLEEIAANAPAADVGLAYALAGQNGRAIEILESAARAPNATARTRQNLALAHAMAGDWRRARAIAAQDISPAELNGRMYQWAAFSRPGADQARVASLMGVTPVEDPGQPVRLALAPAEAAPAPAESRAAFAPEIPAPAEAPIEVAEAAPAEAPAWVPTAQSYQPAPAAEAEAPTPAAESAPVRFAAAPEAEDAGPPAPILPPQEAETYEEAARALVQPRRSAVRSARAATPAPFFQRNSPVRSGNAPVVVQLGAFSNEANAENAWLQHSRRYNLQGRVPLTTTIAINGRNMHRVSVSGFASSADAQRLCGRIKSQGGVCFVRAQAGDASIRWAARYADPRRRAV